MFFKAIASVALLSVAEAAVIDARQAASTSRSSSSSHSSSASRTSSSSASSTVPDYFQTTPELFAGPTPTGPAPFLAETNPAPFPSLSYIPPAPLETQEPISGNTQNASIFQQMGNLSPYFPSPGFGVNEYSLPAGANITWLNMISVRLVYSYMVLLLIHHSATVLVTQPAAVVLQPLVPPLPMLLARPTSLASLLSSTPGLTSLELRSWSHGVDKSKLVGF